MILIDDRQGSVELIPFLPPELTAKHRLESGDAAFFGHGPEGQYTFPIGIEYKKFGDAHSCFLNKRFVGEQYPKMARLYQRIYFIIEGEYGEGSDGRLVVPSWRSGRLEWVSHGWATTYRQFDNWQNSLAETGNVRFKQVKDQRHAAACVLNLYKMWTKDYDHHNSLFCFDKSQAPLQIAEPSLTRLVAAQIPGIGWKKSEYVANAFQSVKQLANAGEKEWLTIQGVGKTMAKRIVNLLESPAPIH